MLTLTGELRRLAQAAEAAGDAALAARYREFAAELEELRARLGAR